MPSQKKLIIAIDGPAGSGKSSVGDDLAERLGYIHLSTGAIYRAIGWKAQQQGITWENIPGLLDLIAQTTIEFRQDPDGNRVIVDGQDVTGILSTNEVGKLASAVAVIPEVRAGVLPLQRQAGKDGGVILDGRDIGTVVFPDADVKFYLDASAEARAQRRYLQLQAQGQTPDLQQLIADIKNRDDQDANRATAPLRQAEDAIYLDSTPYSRAEIVALMEHAIRKIIETH